jgi:hypothetical protein
MKPCPNCESVEPFLKVERSTMFGNWVYCIKCNTGGPSVATQEQAIEAWDALPRRAELPAFHGSTYTIDDIDYQVAFTYNGPITFCSITWNEKRRLQCVYGVSYCNPKDVYDQDIGKRVSIKNACGLDSGSWSSPNSRKLYSAWRKEQREKIQSITPERKVEL